VWSTGLKSCAFLAFLLTGPLAAAREGEPGEDGEVDEEQGESDGQAGVLDGLLQGVSDYSELDLGQLLELPLVESASLRRQSILDSPVTVSVLTRDEIESSGAVNVAQLLARLPGALVLQEGANTYWVGLRGLSALGTNRTMLHVDGSPFHDRLTGLQLWPILPLLPADLERIEVIRGPGSMLYGSDALSGVINLVSRRPLDHAGFEASGWGLFNLLGSQPDGSSPRVWMENGGGASLAYGWVDPSGQLGLRVSGGFNHEPEWSNQAGDFANGPFAYQVRASLQLLPDPYSELRLNFAHAAAETMRVFVFFPVRNPVSAQSLDLHYSRRHLGADWLGLRLDADAHRMTVEFVSLPQEDDSLFVLMPFDLFSIPSESYDAHLRLQLDASLWEDRELLSLAGEVTYFGVADYTSRPWMLFGGVLLNNDLVLLDDRSLIISLGGRFDYVRSHEGSFGDIRYRHLSPKAALIWKPAPDHSLRLSGGSAFRTPQPAETSIDFQVRPGGPDGPAAHVLVGNPRLQPERLYGLELGYQGKLWQGLRLEAVVFGQRVDDLVGLTRETRAPIFKENVQSVHQAGLELSLRYLDPDRVRASLSYTFIYSLDADTGAVVKDWPMHLWSLGADVELGLGFSLGVQAGLQFDYRPLVAVPITPDLGTMRIEWQPRQAADQARVDLRLGKRLFDGTVEIFLMARNLAGFFREAQGLQGIPMDYAQPIGGSLLLGVRAGGF